MHKKTKLVFSIKMTGFSPPHFPLHFLSLVEKGKL